MQLLAGAWDDDSKHLMSSRQGRGDVHPQQLQLLLV
jgi:hypothetical protein